MPVFKWVDRQYLCDRYVKHHCTLPEKKYNFVCYLYHSAYFQHTVVFVLSEFSLFVCWLVGLSFLFVCLLILSLTRLVFFSLSVCLFVCLFKTESTRRSSNIYLSWTKIEYQNNLNPIALFSTLNKR